MSPPLKSPPIQTSFVRVPPITIGIGVALAFAVFVCVATYFLVPAAYKPALVFFAAACAAAGQLASNFYAARVLEATARASDLASQQAIQFRNEDLAQSRSMKAAEFAARWNDATMFHVRENSRTLLELKNDQARILYFLQQDPKNVTNAHHLLNFLEELGQCIRANICDEEVSKHLFRSIVLQVWESVGFYVLSHREVRVRPTLWKAFEGTYDRWKK